MGRPHAPSQARELVAAAQKGRPVRELAAKAREIDDPYHAAWALFQLSRDDPALHNQALELLDAVEQDWRRAELAADVARRVQDDPRIILALARRIVLLPASKARGQALQQITKYVPPESLGELLTAVIQDPETGTDDGKTILRAWTKKPDPASHLDEIDALIATCQDETQARLWGYLHLQKTKTDQALMPDAFTKAVQAAQRAPQRLPLLRYLATVAQTPEELDAVLRIEDQTEPRVRLLLKAVAQADRLGHAEHARSYLQQADRLIPRIPDEKTRSRLEANLAKATTRLQEDASSNPSPKHKTNKDPPIILPPSRGPRGVIGLHNGYTGGLGPPHFRAVARAAPLCAAFGLDLLLIGFPAVNANELIKKTTADTRIGEGAQYARALLDAGRVHWIPPSDHTEPHKWPVRGPIVATTPHPQNEKVTTFDRLGPGAVLVIGLGPQGLPKRLLEKAHHHLELTGHGVSLETATAMGVIAGRLHDGQKRM